MSTVKRMTAQERQMFGRRTAGLTSLRYAQIGEPAMGTTDERLSIIIRRLGGTVGAPRMSAEERRDYARWCAREGVPNPFLAA